MNPAVMLLRVELIVFVGVVFRWCAVLESDVLSAKRSAVAESLGALGALEPHGRGADKQWAFLAERFVVAVDRELDVNLAWGVIEVRQFDFPKKFGAFFCSFELFLVPFPPSGEGQKNAH